MTLEEQLKAWIADRYRAQHPGAFPPPVDLEDES
jgi:hypothetical protein